jgi:hypothetical protein
MKIFDPRNMFRGWYVGDFEPSAYRTKDFEVSVMHHKAGEEWDAHWHEISIEINYLLEGSMKINGKQLEAPIIFVIDREEMVDPEFITDCTLVVIKTPSVPGDKYIATKESER